MRFLLLAALLALPDCGGAPEGQAQAACEQQALDDPAVQAAILRANSPLQEVRVPGVQAQKNAIARAVQRCLSGHGSAPRGGVEPVQNQ